MVGPEEAVVGIDVLSWFGDGVVFKVVLHDILFIATEDPHFVFNLVSGVTSAKNWILVADGELGESVLSRSERKSFNGVEFCSMIAFASSKYK